LQENVSEKAVSMDSNTHSKERVSGLDVFYAGRTKCMAIGRMYPMIPAALF
jgi:hypothetical protein